MEKDNTTLRGRISLLNDEKLIEILNVDYKEYTKEALEIVKEELSSRGIDNVSIHKESDSFTFRELIYQVKFENVARILRKEFHVDKEIIEKYHVVFKQLLKTTPSNETNISIIMDKHYDKLLDSVSDWDIHGIEIDTGESFNVDLYNWEEWMSFYLKTENIDQVGRDLFVAYCLLKMTTFGFDPKEIEKKLREISFKPDEINNEVYIAENVDECTFEVHPWIRFWARTMDVMLFASLLNFIFTLTEVNGWQIIRGIEYVLPISLFLWVLVESVLLSTWGTTPGKVLLGILVRENDGSKLSFSRALNRSASVWFFGMGCGITLIELITKIVSYNRLTKKGITRWDQNGKYKISHTEISILNIVIAVLILIGIPALRYYKIF